ncbi:hypothetical protein [Marinifilum flexuosum]|uniref:hypothetical protein n=1 Tax=Marinifilum flexuosum TaxID=1117708 RepID=UPI001FE757CC|nr:hypothetical protein [Marinifilum flexuosum]
MKEQGKDKSTANMLAVIGWFGLLIVILIICLFNEKEKEHASKTKESTPTVGTATIETARRKKGGRFILSHYRLEENQQSISQSSSPL